MVFARFNANVPQFTRGLELRAVPELAKDYAIAAEDTANDLNDDIANLSPVRSGRYLANWQVTRRRRAATQVAGWRGRDMLAANRRIIRRWAEKLKRTRLDKERAERLFFTNLVPYAERIENGWSKMAPAGVARVAMSRLPAKIRAQPRR